MTPEQIVARKKELLLQKRDLLVKQQQQESSQGESEEPAESGLAKTGRYMAQGARNIAAGVGDVADMPFALADMATYPIRYAARKAADVVMGGEPLEQRAFGKYIPGIGEHVAQGIDTATGGYTAPRTGGEKVTAAVTRGLAGLPAGGGAATLITKGAKYLPAITKAGAEKVAKGLSRISAPTAGNIGSTAGSSAASQAYMNANPEDNGLGAFISGAAGGIGGQKGARAVRNTAVQSPWMAAANRVGKTLRINPEKAAAMGDLPYSLGDVIDNKFTKGIQNKLDWAPIASGTMGKFYQKQGKAIRGKLGVGEFPMDEEGAGRLIHQSAEKQHTQHNKMMGNLQDTFEEPINAGQNLVEAPTALGFNPSREAKYITNTGKELYNEKPAPRAARKLQEMAEEVADMENPAGNKITIGKDQVDFTKHPHLKSMIESKINETLGDISAGKVPYEEMQLVKRQIDDAVSTYGQIGNISQKDLKILRGSIKNDLDNHFNKIGGKAKDAWNNFNKEGATFAKNVKPNINDIFKANEKGLTAVFVDAINDRKSNPRKIRVIYEGLSPQNKEKLFGAYMNDMGKSGTNEWSIFKARKNFTDMRKAQQNVLLEGLPNAQARKDFRKVMGALDLINEKKLAANTSATSHHEGMSRWLGKGNTLAKSIVGTAVGTAGLFAPIPIIAAMLAPAAVAKGVFTNEKLLRWAAKGMEQRTAVDMKRHLGKVPELKTTPQALVNSALSTARSLGSGESKRKPLKIEITQGTSAP